MFIGNSILLFLVLGMNGILLVNFKRKKCFLFSENKYVLNF